MNRLWIVVALGLAGCPIEIAQQGAEAPESADAAPPDDAGWPEEPVEPQVAARAPQDAGIVEPDAEPGTDREPDASLVDVDAASEPDAGSQGAVDYDLEGVWGVVSTPDSDQRSTCAAGVQLPILTERWVIQRLGGEMVVSRGEGAIAVLATLKFPGTYNLAERDQNPHVPIAGGVHWVVTVEGSTFVGDGWQWVDSADCGGAFHVEGELHGTR